MSSRYGFFCFLLALAIALLGYKNHEIWSAPSPEPPRREAAKKTDAKAEAAPAASPAREDAGRESFLLIGEKNIFNPERREFPVLAVEQQQQVKPVVRPQVILYGVVIGGDYQSASIANPGRPLHKGEREEKTIRPGERIGEYQLTKIAPDRIILEAPGDSFEVLLFDPRSPKRRVEVKTASRPAAVTSVVPGAAPAIPPPATKVPAVTASPLPPPSPPAALPRSTPQVSPKPPQVSGPAPQPGAAGTFPDPGVWRGRRPAIPPRSGAN